LKVGLNTPPVEQSVQESWATRWRIGARVKVVIPFVAFIILWQIIASSELTPPYLVPSPLVVARAFGMELTSGRIFLNLGRSLEHYLLGLAWGISWGILFGLGLAWFRWADEMLEPFIDAFRPIPPVAWIPFVLLWMGIRTESAAFIISIAAFYTCLRNTYAGVKGVDKILIEAAHTLGENTSVGLIRRVVLPAALPSIITGVRVSLGLGWMSLIAAEIFGIQGLGLRMVEAGGLLAMDVVIVYMIVIGGVNLLTDRGFKLIEARLLRWK
jgi:NitT/TauT family transport system permease protein